MGVVRAPAPHAGPRAGAGVGAGRRRSGFGQRIFYLHVPVALTAYGCLAVAGWKALDCSPPALSAMTSERRRRPHRDLWCARFSPARSGRHLVGVWWTWSENQLVLFLVIFLFYSAYFMLRQSVPAGVARARCLPCSALLGIVLIPISFLADPPRRELCSPGGV